MATLYLSYKDEEKPWARALAAELSELGHEAIFDAVAGEPGQNWRDVLAVELARSDAVIVLLTEKALLSPFVMGEIGAARALARRFGKPILLPVLVGGIDEPEVISDLLSIPMKRNIQGINRAAHELTATFSNALTASSSLFLR